MNKNKMSTEIVRIKDLTEKQKDSMFSIMLKYFDNVNENLFRNDLKEKEWVIILAEQEKKEIYGFTTIMIIEDVVMNIPVKAVYSGDTIVDRSCWNIFSLERSWVPFVFSIVKKQPEYKWYWFLVSKGYRTYRYFPAYFYKFIPSPIYEQTVFESMVLKQLAQKKFGNAYNCQTGIIRCPNDYRLKAGVSDITTREMNNNEIAFYVQKNPDWKNGAELSCLAELCDNNIKPIIKRMLNHKGIKTI